MIVHKFDRNLADIRRWGIVRTVREQSVAEHSFFVALWVPRLLAAAGYGGDKALLFDAMAYALEHDKDEVVSGDSPTPFKKRLPEGVFQDAVATFGLSPPEPKPLIKAAVKVLDLFEAAMFVAEEMNLGNKRMDRVYGVIQSKLADCADNFETNFFTEEAKKFTNYKLARYLMETLRKTREEQADPLE